MKKALNHNRKEKLHWMLHTSKGPNWTKEWWVFEKDPAKGTDNKIIFCLVLGNPFKGKEELTITHTFQIIWDPKGNGQCIFVLYSNGGALVILAETQSTQLCSPCGTHVIIHSPSILFWLCEVKNKCIGQTAPQNPSRSEVAAWGRWNCALYLDWIVLQVCSLWVCHLIACYQFISIIDRSASAH